MLYQMSKPEEQSYIAQYGKAYGTVLLKKWLPSISRTKKLFVLDSYEEFQKIEDELPEKFTCRADAKTGENPTLRGRRKFCYKRKGTGLYKTCKRK